MRAAGWINVVVAAIVMLATLPGRTQGLGLITEPMLGDLQLDRVTYATINLWATLIGAVICLPIGRVFDTVGLRSTTLVLTLSLAVVVWSMSRLEGGVWPLFALILATRALGQSALSISSITTVGKTFGKNAGLPMGVYSVLLSVFFMLAFVAVGGSVRAAGWRTAWSQVAIGLVVLAAPAVLFLREPTAVGAGAYSAPGAADGGPPDVAAGATLGEALRTPAFWIFAVATSLFGLVSSGLGLFNQHVLAERGFPQEIYVTFLAGTAIIALVGQFGCGWLTRTWPMPRLLAIAMGIYGAALGALPFVTTQPQLWVVAVMLGLSGGMVTVLFFAVWGHAFGQAHLGRIQGAAQMLTVLASAIGPLIFAKGFELTGSYTPALWVLAPCVLAIGASALRLRLPSAAAR
ncbi:MAG: MFS transporter [Vicinamibacteraceae bacterium]